MQREGRIICEPPLACGSLLALNQGKKVGVLLLSVHFDIGAA